MNLEIAFFGRFSDILTSGSFSLPPDITKARDVAVWLSSDHPTFAEQWSRAGNRMILNGELLHGDHDLQDGDELAFLSPLSGG